MAEDNAWYSAVHGSTVCASPIKGGRMDTTQLLKGVLDLAILAVLAEEDGYGYDVVRRLRDAGWEEVGDASVYGTLRRLYGAGHLTSYVVPSDEGPNRKYYGLNGSGRAHLALSMDTWSTFSKTLDALLEQARTEDAA
jgi:PadR family transcriptional regulator PadR